MIHWARQIEQLQARRARTDAASPIARLVADIAHEASRTQKRLGAIIEIWEQLVPPSLTRHTTLTGIRRGVLHVAVDSASAAFELDRLLRGGLEARLRERYRGSLERVRVRAGGREQGHEPPMPPKRPVRQRPRGPGRGTNR